jgi:hypothetical protein
MKEDTGSCSFVISDCAETGDAAGKIKTRHDIITMICIAVLAVSSGDRLVFISTSLAASVKVILILLTGYLKNINEILNKYEFIQDIAYICLCAVGEKLV